MADTNIRHKDVGSELSKTEWEAADSHTVTHAITDNAILTVDGTVEDNDYMKATTAGAEGRTYSEVKSDLTLNLVENTAHSTDAHTMTIDGVDVSTHATTVATDSVLGHINLLDEDTMVSDSATKGASQQSIKAYVDAVAAGAFTIERLAAEPALELSKMYHNTVSHKLFYCKEDA